MQFFCNSNPVGKKREAMKPLSELVKEIRKREPRNWSSENADYYRGLDAGIVYAADLLEAWLREADWELIHSQLSRAELIMWIRESVLGTTRAEGEK